MYFAYAFSAEKSAAHNSEIKVKHTSHFTSPTYLAQNPLFLFKNYSFLCQAITQPADLLFLLSQKSSPPKGFEERHIFTRQHIKWCRYYYTSYKL